MERTKARIEKPIWIAIIVASAVAATTFNSIAFGLNALRVYDSSVHTFFIAIGVATGIIAIDFRFRDRSFLFRILLVIVAIIPLTYIGVWLAAIWLYFLNPFQEYRNFGPSNRTILFSLSISYIFGLGGYLLTSARQNLFAAKRTIEEKAIAEEKSRVLAREARLASLESRIHPHFLFNTLNSIAALIREDPVRAERTVEQLSSVLRFSLSPENESTTTIRNEIKLVSDYLEIQKTRFEDRLQYSFDVEEKVLDSTIPSFAVHTLVENSLKHGVTQNSNTLFLEISVNSEDGVNIEVSDTGGGFQSDVLEAGHGLDNLRERIKAIHGDLGYVDLSASDEGVVRVRIPRTT